MKSDEFNKRLLALSEELVKRDTALARSIARAVEDVEIDQKRARINVIIDSIRLLLGAQ